MQLCLGIESTAHTFGVAVVSFEGEILANARDMYTTEKGGMIPMEVARHHEKVKENVLKEAFESAGASWDDISLISVASGPGLPPCLKVGVEFATRLAREHNKPLIGVNHCVAHLTVGNLTTGLRDPVYLYVSGGNTQVIARGGDRFRVFGETVDIALGNALDKFAREVGLGFPGGPKVEALAMEGEYVELPYSVKGMDVAFAGLVTRAVQLFRQGVSIEDLCFSLQETAFAMLAEVCERALAHCGKEALVLIGGVAANKRLCQMLRNMAEERGAEFAACPVEYAGDQGAMIAWQGILEFSAGRENSPEDLDIDSSWRTDEVNITWD